MIDNENGPDQCITAGAVTWGGTSTLCQSHHSIRRGNEQVLKPSGTLVMSLVRAGVCSARMHQHNFPFAKKDL